jgi:hypothetical protein
MITGGGGRGAWCESEDDGYVVVVGCCLNLRGGWGNLSLRLQASNQSFVGL